ncbi:MAG: TIR domain-containing protein, partial [Chloroflexota bacterium]
MADVFISYSRANVDFARRLAQELRTVNYDLWIDLEGIRFNADWWDEIKRGIEHSNNFVLVMSPNSLGSPVCHLEIEYARKLSKRIILLNHVAFERKEVSRAMLDRLASDAYVNTLLGDRNPMTLFDNNWYVIEKYQRVNFTYDASKSTKFRGGELETDSEQADRNTEETAFLNQFVDLRAALEIDLDHVNFHTHMGLRDRDWERSQRNESFLLFGDELTQAERWLADYDADAQIRSKNGTLPKLPKPTNEQHAYIQASHVVEIARTQRLRNIRRAGIGAGLAATAALIFAIGASLVGVNGINQSNTANTQVAVANIAQGQAVAAQNTAIDNAKRANLEVAAANATLTPIAQQVQDMQFLNESLRLASEANAVLQQTDNDKLSAVLLGIRALKVGYSSQADNVLLQALQLTYFYRGFIGHRDVVSSVTFSPDGQYVLTG